MSQPHESERNSGIAPKGPARKAVLSRLSPIDLVHLSHQTAGDPALETEVLGLLVIQIERVSSVIETASKEERARLAHALKGAARNLGAFRLAEAAERFERDSADTAAMDALLRELDETGRFARDLSAA
ncbi:Hpt domain-containing protein [Jiella mangrovi]|uniref:Hpt domain-containing protein n=1 Tax=Jiella mangrovi TaxID=2821407 RepID=A0ABS4BJT6_9HYPH|nr:Hpt domain-containing protein [Jiella mangrovi]